MYGWYDLVKPNTFVIIARKGKVMDVTIVNKISDGCYFNDKKLLKVGFNIIITVSMSQLFFAV